MSSEPTKPSFHETDACDIDRHIERRVRQLTRAKIDRLAGRVIRRLKQLREGYCLSGFLGSVWEEWKYQVQIERSFHYDVYVDTVRDFCRAVCDKLSAEDRELLWIYSEAFQDLYFKGHKANISDQQTADCVVDEVYSRVTERAGSEELKDDQ